MYTGILNKSGVWKAIKHKKFILPKKLNPFSFANERTEMKLKIYLSEAWMCSEFGMLITDVERERVKTQDSDKDLTIIKSIRQVEKLNWNFSNIS